MIVIARRETTIRYWKSLKKPDGSVDDFYRCDRCGKVGRWDVFVGKDYCPACGRVIVDVIGSGGETGER